MARVLAYRWRETLIATYLLPRNARSARALQMPAHRLRSTRAAHAARRPGSNI